MFASHDTLSDAPTPLRARFNSALPAIDWAAAAIGIAGLICILLGTAIGANGQTTGLGEVMMDEAFVLPDGGALVVNVSDADLEVRTQASRNATVQIYLNGRNMDRARSYFAEQHFTVGSEGNTIVVRTDRERRYNWGFNRSGGARITVVATIPVAANLLLATSDGDISLADINGNVDIKTSDGDVRFDAIRSVETVIRTSDGDISGSLILGESLSVRTADGDMRIKSIEGGAIDVVTSDGDITFGTVLGSATIRTSDGDIQIDHAEGQEVSFRTSDGDIHVGSTLAGSARVHTSNGSVSLNHVEGRLEATSSDGDISVVIAKPSELDLRTTDGSIDVGLYRGVPANVELSGGRIQLSSELSFSGTVEKRSAHGTVNGGGKVIRARASDGRIRVRPVSG